MNPSIFATYKTGENRVTASVLAVLRSLALHRIERLLGALMEESELQLIRFQNQPSKGAAGVPDASITANCRILIETKTARNSVKQDQLVRHLERLDETTETLRALVGLTPDESDPQAFADLNDPRAVWASFAAFDQPRDRNETAIRARRPSE